MTMSIMLLRYQPKRHRVALHLAGYHAWPLTAPTVNTDHDCSSFLVSWAKFSGKQAAEMRIVSGHQQLSFLLGPP